MQTYPNIIQEELDSKPKTISDELVKAFRQSLREEDNENSSRVIDYFLKNKKVREILLDEVATFGKLEFVQKLVEAGTNVNCKHPKEKTTPLYTAAVNGKVEVTKYLLENGADVNTHSQLDSPLILVAANNLSIVQLLVEYGADVNTSEEFGSNVLEQAAYYGNKSVINFLLEKGAEWESCVKDIMEMASNSGSVEIIELFEEKGVSIPDSLLHNAVNGDQLELLKFLLNKNLDVNALDEYSQQTPLHEAASKGNYEIAKLLLENNANVNAISDSQETPLFSAVEEEYDDERLQKRLQLIELLIDKGADVNFKNKSKNTPLHKAAKLGLFEIVKLLVEKGADVSAKNKQSKTSISVTVDDEIKSFLKQNQ